MKQITRSQIVALWLCLGYFGVVFLIIAARAAWGYLRLASEYRDVQVPREVLLNVATSASQDVWFHVTLVGFGFAALACAIMWLAMAKKV